MEKTITIVNKGIARGTVGWLLVNLTQVTIGVTKRGDRAAWMHIGEELVCIVIHDAYDVADRFPECDRLDLVERHGNRIGGISLPWCVTDACWESIEVLAEEIRTMMNEDAASETPVRFTLTPKS